MADIQEIAQLLYRYGSAHDSQDLDAVRACFADDMEAYGQKGADAVLEFYVDAYSKATKKRRHVLTNVHLLEDGDDRALVQSYLTLYLIADGTKLELSLTGVYRHEVVRRDGEWKIFSMQGEMDVPYDPGDLKGFDYEEVDKSMGLRRGNG